MIHNPHAVARLAKVPNVNPLRERLGQTDAHQRALTAIRLIKIAWGKPDRALASVVRNSIGCATPATVIPWAPGQGGLRRRLRSMHVHTDIDDQPISHVHKFIPAEELTK